MIKRLSIFKERYWPLAATHGFEIGTNPMTAIGL